MTQKLRNLSKIVASMTAEQQALWKESLSVSKPVLDTLAVYLAGRVAEVDKEMRLDAVLKTADAAATMLSLQAKKEAYQDLMSLIVDK